MKHIYFNKYKTKSELLYSIKTKNEKFFDRDTMRFFGPQKISIIETDGVPLLKIVFTRCPRVTFYSIDPETLNLKAV